MAESQTSGCICPEGYTLSPDGLTCIKTVTTPATIPPGTPLTCQGSNEPSAYNGGARFYNDITSLPKPIKLIFPTPTTASIVDGSNTTLPFVLDNTAPWANAGAPNNRLSRVGVWACPTPCLNCYPQKQWIGFSVCVDVAETKKYSLGIAGDNAVRITLNGNATPEVYIAPLLPNGNCYPSTQGGSTWPFLYWHIFEITLNAGLNTIFLEGYNCEASATFGAEIYDASIAQLQTISSEAILDQYILFSTRDQVGQPFSLGFEYTCPDGSTISDCGTPECTQILQAQPLCCYRLSDCGGEYASILTNTDLSAYIGSVITIDDPAYANVCWQVQSSLCTDFAVPVTVVSSYQDCDTCVRRYFTLNDCCCNKPYAIELAPTVFVYTGSGANPDPYLTQAIFSVYDSTPQEWFRGCSVLTEIFDIPPGYTTANYEQYFTYVFAQPDCAYCKQCISGYRLVDCLGENDDIITTSDLSAYVGQSVQIAGFPDMCWTVNREDNICTEIFPLDIVVDASFPDCVICLTQYYKLTSCCVEGETIITATNLADSINQYIKLNNDPTVCWFVEETDEYTGAQPVSKASSAEVFRTCYACIPKTYRLHDCTGEAPDIYVNNDFSQYTQGVVKVDYCDTCYLVEEILCQTATKTVVFNEYFETCEDCLPKVLPPPPVELITRRVKPGYYTKGCPPEYTEKISCKFGDTMFDDVAKVRYGIDICCDHDVEKWWIKKELLNLKAIYDPALDCPPKVCYCYTIVQTAGTTDFKYISCDGDCTMTTLVAGDTQYVCSQTWPSAICPDPEDLYTIESTTTCTNGESCEPPPPVQCYCYYLAGSNPITISYTDCAGIPLTETYEDGSNINICAQKDTITVVEGVIKVQEERGDCNETYDCLSCDCYIIKCLTDFPGVLSGIDCNNQPINITVNSFKGIYICLKQVDAIVSRTLEVKKINSLSCPTGCEETCRCLQLFAATGNANISYLTCDDSVGVVVLGQDQTVNICAKPNSLTIRSLASPTITDIGSCPCPLPPPPCKCYQIRGDANSGATFTDCDNQPQSAIFSETAIKYACAQEDSFGGFYGNIDVILQDIDCSTDPLVCRATCNCYEFVVPASEPAISVTYYRCSDGQMVTEFFKGNNVYRVCAILTPTTDFAGIIFTTVSDCTDTQICGTPCGCYKITNILTENVGIAITDCNDVSFNVLLLPGVSYYYCAKLILGCADCISVEIQSSCNGESICENPPPCQCYSLLAVEGLFIPNPYQIRHTDCATGNLIDTVYPEGTVHLICSRTQPVYTSYPIGSILPEITLIDGSNCNQTECTLVCNCYTVTNLGASTAALYWADCDGVIQAPVELEFNVPVFVCSSTLPFVADESAENNFTIVNNGPCQGSICQIG